MSNDLQGQGVLGIAFETAIGTYVPPTKWIPIRSETLARTESKKYRMNIRGIADRTPGVQGNQEVAGDIAFEVTHDTLPYFLYLARVNIAKVGAGAPYTYTFTPAHVARPSTAASGAARRTASILVARSGHGFGYVGMSVGQLAFTYDDETLVCTASLAGVGEADQTIPSQTWPTSSVFGPVENSVELPTATARADLDSLSFTINDNVSSEHRIDGSRDPAFVRWGEREVTASAEVDFDTLADYNHFLAQDIQELTIKAIRDAAAESIVFTLKGTIEDSYAVNLSSLGDLNRAAVDYHATYNAADAYQIVCKTSENIA